MNKTAAMFTSVILTIIGLIMFFLMMPVIMDVIGIATESATGGGEEGDDIPAMEYLMGYVHMNNVDDLPSNEILSNYDHMIYSYGYPGAGGNLTIGAGGATLDTFVTAAHTAGAEAILGIYDSQAVLDDICDDPPGLLDTFMDALSDAVSTYSLDGFCVDWESVDKTTSRMTSLLTAMRAEFPTLTLMDVQAVNPRTTSAAIANAKLDFILIMAYDLYGTQPLPYHSVLGDCKAAMKNYEHLGYHAEKLILGIPWYAKDNNGSICTWEIVENDFSPADNIDYLSADNVSEGFASSPETIDGGVIWFGGKDTLRSKVDFVRYQGYGGAFVFDLTQDGNNLLPVMLTEATTDLPADPDLQLYHVNNSTQNSASVLTNQWQGQTFTTTERFTVQQVVLALNQTAGSGDITVGIRATVAGLPVGSNLVEDTVLSASLPQDQYGRVVFDFGTGMVLAIDTKYALCVSTTENTVWTKYLLNNGDFADGNMCHSADGSSWTADANNDMYFEVLGVE